MRLLKPRGDGPGAALSWLSWPGLTAPAPASAPHDGVFQHPRWVQSTACFLQWPRGQPPHESHLGPSQLCWLRSDEPAIRTPMVFSAGWRPPRRPGRGAGAGRRAAALPRPCFLERRVASGRLSPGRCPAPPPSARDTGRSGRQVSGRQRRKCRRAGGRPAQVALHDHGLPAGRGMAPGRSMR